MEVGECSSDVSLQAILKFYSTPRLKVNIGLSASLNESWNTNNKFKVCNIFGIQVDDSQIIYEHPNKMSLYNRANDKYRLMDCQIEDLEDNQLNKEYGQVLNDDPLVKIHREN